MIESKNPYQSPLDAKFPSVNSEAFDKFAFVAWPIVFGVNLILPLFFGWGLTQDHGRTGMFVALFGFLSAGWSLCLLEPMAARKLIAGSIITGVSQVFPVLHIISGTIALEITMRFGLVVVNDAAPLGHDVSSETGGFLATLLVGCFLLVCAAGTGRILGFLLPASWLMPNRWRNVSGDPRRT